MIVDIPTVWLERCIQIIDTDPATAQPAIGQPGPPRLCSQCWKQGREIVSVRPVGNFGYCAIHLADLYATFSEEAWIDGGVGLQCGSQRLEFGPLEADLECCCCQATWVGIPGDACWHCDRLRQLQIEHQARLTLKPPDVDPDDVDYDTRMRAWVERMAVATKAGLITETRARAVWRAATQRTAAA